MERPRLGFIGLGAMGMPMVLRLLQAGHAVTVWGREPRKLARALGAGAGLADSPARLAAAVEVVMVCVTDTRAVEEVVFGPNGIAAAGAAGKLLVDHSSIHPLESRGFAERLRRECGMGWVDAPVSGGVKGAEDGTLVVMAGGEKADVERARPILAAFSQRLTHMGPSGAGQATKVCNQMIIGATIGVVAEAFSFAARFGVSAPDIPDCLAGGWADSTVLQVHGRRMAAADYADAPPAAIMVKDMEIAADMGRLTGTPMPVTSLVTSLYRLLIAQGHEETGQIGLMRLYADGPLPRL